MKRAGRIYKSRATVDDDAEVTEFLSSAVSEPPLPGENSVAEDSVSLFYNAGDLSELSRLLYSTRPCLWTKRRTPSLPTKMRLLYALIRRRRVEKRSLPCCPSII